MPRDVDESGDVSASPETPEASAAPDGHGLPGQPVPGMPDPDGAGEDPGEEPFDIEEFETSIQGKPSPGLQVHPGSRRKGTVVAIVRSEVIISFGTKVEGRVPLDEFRDASGAITVAPGHEVDVLVERLGSSGELAVLSYRRAREAVAWREVEQAHAQHLPVQARVVQRVKGGLRVDIGVSAFLPGSQVDIRPVRNLDAWIGKTIDVVVVECNRRRSNAVVSRSELLRAERQAQLEETLARLKVGEPATGTVKNITSYGVFVDLGGIDGLIKLTDLSYGRVGHPSNVVSPGDEVTAKVLKVDPDRERVALSLRAMRPDPWISIGERMNKGDRVTGKVTSVTDYGVFVELEPGVEGLIHVTEIDWSRRPKHPSKTFSPGSETEALVLGVKPADHRVSLSFKRLTPDPWDQYGPSLEVGLVVEGTVRRITTYGLFVEIVEGIEGLVHVSDLSWDTRARNPRAAAQKGQSINTVILHTDIENRRLSLGLKQLEPDTWDTFLSQYAVGDTVPGEVRRLVKFGAFVELAPGVEGLCHRSQSPQGRNGLQAGLRYSFDILNVNESARRIGLRCRRAVPLDEVVATPD